MARKFAFAVSLFTMVAIGTLGTTTSAQDRVRWKLSSAYPSSLEAGASIVRWSDNIATMTDGNFRIEVFEPGALVPALEQFDAVSNGAIDIAYTSPGFYQGKLPQLAFFASVPFGPSVNEYLAWVQGAGGYALYDRELRAHNIKGFQCGVGVAQSSGWFREPIESLDDLKGLKMRFYGLGADVMQKFDVDTQMLAPADIYPALERGVIDATEFAYPSLDRDLGFYQVAKHYYFPGWHDQVSFVDVLINLDRWNELPPSYQKIIEIACGEALVWTIASAEAKQGKALAFVESKGVAIRQWPEAFLRAFRGAWEEVAAERAAANPNFREVYDHYTKFRENYAPWREISSLPSNTQ